MITVSSWEKKPTTVCDLKSLPPNKRIEPMTSSAVCQALQFDAVDALLVTAHPQR